MAGAKSIIGHAVTIHNKTDDCSTVPSSGARLGFGVIGIENLSYNEETGTNEAVFGGTTTSASCVLQALSDSGITGNVYFEVCLLKVSLIIKDLASRCG